MDKALEERLRDAINDEGNPYKSLVLIEKSDAKRLLYRMIKENSKGNELVYKERKKS